MKKIISVALILVVLVTAFASCKGPEEKILGAWKCTEEIIGGISQEKTYVFSEGGTGTVSVVGEVAKLNMRWSIYEKNLTIEIDTSADVNIIQSIINMGSALLTDPVTYGFKIKGDTLTLTAADGTVTTLTRVAE